MAGIRAIAQTSEVSTGTAAKTLLQIAAAANHRVLVVELSVSFDGTDSAGAPILVEILRQTDAGTMSSLTPVKVDADGDETLQTTAQENATAEPTAGDVIMREQVHPQGGGWTWQAPFGRELVLTGGERLGVRVTAAAAVNAVARVVFEE